MISRVLGAGRHLLAAFVQLIGVLRLRGCFASRSSHSAQDDNLKEDKKAKGFERDVE